MGKRVLKYTTIVLLIGAFGCALYSADKKHTPYILAGLAIAIMIGMMVHLVIEMRK